jgi:hypothetical protein
MMQKAADVLPQTPLPAFLLLKNMHEDWPGIVGLDAACLDGEVLWITDSFEEAHELVPAPTVPTDPEKLALLQDRFGVDHCYDPETGEWTEHLPHLAFDTDPDHNGLRLLDDVPRDFDIFGESYTVVWVCPADVQAVVDRLMGHAAERLTGRIGIPAPLELLRLFNEADPRTARRIDGYDLFEIWRQYIDRICFFAPELEPAEGPGGSRSELREQIINTFSAQLKGMPNGPGDEDWEVLEEMLLK